LLHLPQASLLAIVDRTEEIVPVLNSDRENNLKRSFTGPVQGLIEWRKVIPRRAFFLRKNPFSYLPQICKVSVQRRHPGEERVLP
jgi:hypothetical protein